MKYRITSEDGHETLGWLFWNESIHEPAVRGDTGGTRSSYESRTVDELVKLAQSKGIELTPIDSKADVIAKLREANRG